MNYFRRIWLIIRYDGLSKLFSHIVLFIRNKVGITDSKKEVFKKNHRQLEDEFYQKALAMGYDGLRYFDWYHTIDLGNGLVTPGHFDYRSSLPLFLFPEDMTGMSVLDIGAANGFFSFEFEKKGANVTSVEVPSITDWEALGIDKIDVIKECIPIERKANSTIEELHHFNVDGPFPRDFLTMSYNRKINKL